MPTDKDKMKKLEDAYHALAAQIEEVAQSSAREADHGYVNTDLIHWLVSERRRLHLFPQILRRRLGT